MTDACSLSLQLPALKLLIEGPHVDPVEGGTLPVVNPATGVKSAPVGGHGASGWGGELTHHTLGGYLQSRAAGTKLPSEI